MIANPILADITAVSEVKAPTSIGKSILFEIACWLVFPFSFTLYVGLWLLVYVSLEETQRLLSQEIPAPISALLFNLSTLIGWLIATTVWYSFATKMFFRARRSAIRYRLNAHNTLNKDPRHPILYLRSFSEEYKENTKRRSLKTGEEDLAFALKYFGPLIALGNPADDISPLGAIRIYLKDNGWQENVRRLMAISQLIVIEAGTSKGLLWEMEVILREGNPTKLLVSFLSWQELDKDLRAGRYVEFKSQIEKTISEATANVRPSFPEKIEDAKFMVFTHDWKPELVKLNKWKKRLYYFSKSILTTETLRPVLRSRELKLRRWKRNIYLLYICWVAFSPFMIVAPAIYTIAAVLIYPAFLDNSFLTVIDTVIYFALMASSVLGISILFNWLGSSILIITFRALKKKSRLIWRDAVGSRQS